jgi:glycosyltransferase involved in cell wall biosynthesis
MLSKSTDLTLFHMSPPKICIFTETYYPVVGGGEKQARELAEGLMDRGFRIMVLTRRSNATFKKIEDVGPVTVYRLPPVGRWHFKKWGLMITGLLLLIRLRRQYDLIFVSGFRVIGISAVMISRLLGKACILKADSPGEMSGKFFAGGLAKLRLNPSSFIFRIWLSIRNRIIRRANRFVAISSDMHKELVSHGVNPKMIKLIPNSTDINIFCPVTRARKHELRRKFGISRETTVVTFTGRLVSYKGLPLLLRVWKEIASIHDNVKLLIVGSGGLDIHNCEYQLKRFVKNNNLQESVRFVGEVLNVHEYLQASDIFVFPTENEGLPLSLIEAMACGLPVISTFVGGIKDILQHQKNGILIKPRDFKQLYDALECIINDFSFADNLGQAGLKTVRENYSKDIIIQKYIKLFESAMRVSH